MMAIIGFVSSLFCCWPLGLLFSFIGLRDSKRRGGAGSGLSIAGIVISALSAAIFLLMIIGNIGLGAWMLSIIKGGNRNSEGPLDPSKPPNKPIKLEPLPSASTEDEMRSAEFLAWCKTTIDEWSSSSDLDWESKNKLRDRTFADVRHAYIAVYVTNVKPFHVVYPTARKDKRGVLIHCQAIGSGGSNDPFDPRSGARVSLSALEGLWSGALTGDRLLKLEATLDDEGDPSGSHFISYDHAQQLSRGDIVVIDVRFAVEHVVTLGEQPEPDFHIRVTRFAPKVLPK